MGAVCWYVSRMIESFAGRAGLTAKLLDVGGSIFIGMAVFYLTARLLSISELDQMTSVIMRRLRKKRN